MTLEEVLEQAQALYPTMRVSKAAARKWVGRGLVQAPSIEGRGYAKGIVAHYSTDSPAQLATAAFLKYGLERRFQDAEIARARLFWLSGGKAQGEEAEAILPGLLALTARQVGDVDVLTCSLPLTMGLLIYASRLEMARKGMDVREPVKTVFEVVFARPSDCLEVRVTLQKIEPAEDRDEIEVTV